MGNIVIKIVEKYYPKDSDIKKLFKYIAGKSKNKAEVRYYNGRGIPKKTKLAAIRMIMLQEFYKKNDKRRIYQICVTFSESVEDANIVKICAEQIADMIFKRGFQVYYGIHEDTDNLHIHFAVNAVSYLSGKKWHMSKCELEEFKEQCENICYDIL